MATGQIKRDESARWAALYATNISAMEDDVAGAVSTAASALETATDTVTRAGTTLEEAETALTEMDGILESLSLSRASRLNRPNMLKQNYWSNRNVPTSAVIKQTLTVPAEDATAAESTLTFTVTDAAITADYVLLMTTSSNSEVIDWTTISASCSAGSATVTIGARKTEHSAAVTVNVYLCTVATAKVPYGDAYRIKGSGAPCMHSINKGEYIGDDSVDGIVCTVVDLTGTDVITEPDGEVYNTAIQYSITENTAYMNCEWLMYNDAPSSISYKQGQTPPKCWGQIEEMQPGKTYTMSFLARVISGDGALARFGYGSSWTNPPYKTDDGHGDLSDVKEITGAEWKRYYWTFEYNPQGDWYTETSKTVDDVTTITRSFNFFKKPCFGIGRKYTAVIQACGFRMVEGGMWLPTPYDRISENVEELGETVSSTKAAVQASIADSETETAKRNHTAGDLFILNDKLYRCTGAIAAGETFYPGINCVQTSVEAELPMVSSESSAAFYCTLLRYGKVRQVYTRRKLEDQAYVNPTVGNFKLFMSGVLLPEEVPQNIIAHAVIKDANGDKHPGMVFYEPGLKVQYFNGTTYVDANDAWQIETDFTWLTLN